ncbi:MAG: hypothetical protein CO108_30070 [Deltaproteobacteria bacterium CG_4_9_14_3_um_filter_63_12]|nr:MAG: hypothetical protein CO108_30070 [Deltaproteobacteria bacterium CG_4_9_14_3_um_filter_63_12]
MASRTITVLLAVVLLLAPTSLFAQNVDEDGFAIVSEAQGQLNAEGIQAMQAEDWVKAIRLFTSANDLAELNLTYLNLGRALTRAGRCEEAIVAYDKVLDTPKVREPSPDLVEKKLNDYRVELAKLCPGKIAISCTPPEMLISIDKAAAVPCPKDPITLEAGQHSVDGDANGKKLSLKVTVAPIATTDVQLALDTSADVVPDKVAKDDKVKTITIKEGKVDDPKVTDPNVSDPKVIPETASSSLAPWGWTVLGLGGAALATGLILEFTVLQGTVDDLQTASGSNDVAKFNSLESDLSSQQGINLGLYIGGGVLVTTGIILLAIDANSETSAANDLFVPWAAAHGAGLGWVSRF